ncbi:MAG: zf-TFIIB domain-containing protein [Xanthomonadales bacterium]|nr:zf-TFIIB domain-containing protein [Xanthomonadales bacterium]
MLCPKCRTQMEKIDVDGIEVDRCEICEGLWFDAGEAQALRNRKAAGKIDIGDAWEGRQLDFIDRYACPRCGGKMRPATDKGQRHIHYEACAECGGKFFDAGEFRDLSSRSVSDFVKRLIGRS